MQKILNSKQIQLADSATIERQKVTSIELMESASEAFVDRFLTLFKLSAPQVYVLCGTGKNGGDGLAIARLLNAHHWDVSVFIYRTKEKECPEFSTNLERLRETSIQIQEGHSGDLPLIQQDVVIDALLGTGLNRPLQEDWLRMIQLVNEQNKYVVSVDVPTGMPADGGLTGKEMVLRADVVISFQLPKLSFFLPESEGSMLHFEVVDIGLDEDSRNALPSDYAMIEEDDAVQLLRIRTAFSHKGTYGNALILAGNKDTLGAALLCAEACLHVGAGLTTACIPEESLLSLTIRCPEVMFLSQGQLAKRWAEYTVVGIGPGLGDRSELLRTLSALEKKPMLLDADALNWLSRYPDLLAELPAQTILTPHKKEFDRLFGPSENWWKRLQLAREKAKEHQCIIVLKNRYSFIVLPSGQVHINQTGNPAMASGGMGDVLSGIITGLLAQGYSSGDAAILGVYVHGKAADVLASRGMSVVTAAQVISMISFVLGDLNRLKSLSKAR